MATAHKMATKNMIAAKNIWESSICICSPSECLSGIGVWRFDGHRRARPLCEGAFSRENNGTLAPDLSNGRLRQPAGAIGGFILTHASKC
mgnify:CR=1 FL=1